MRNWKNVKLGEFRRIGRCERTAVIALVLILTLSGQRPVLVRAEEESSREVVTQEIYHHHIGSEQEGSGCYQEAVRHHHEGSASVEGGCYRMPIYHLHTGNAVAGGGCFAEKVYHTHSGSSVSGGGCYQTPVKHVHRGSASAGGGCYSVPVYHVHTEVGGGCYEPVYHTHTSDCYKTERCNMEYKGALQVLRTENNYCSHHGNTQHAEIKGSYWHTSCGAGMTDATHYMCWTCQRFNKNHDYQSLICTKGEATIEEWRLVCAKGSEAVETWQLGCGSTAETVESYKNSCGKTEKTIDSYKRNCGKNEQSIDAYAINCGNTEETIEFYKRSCKREEETPYARISIINHNNSWTAGAQRLEASYEELNSIETEGNFLKLGEQDIYWEKIGEGNRIEVTENGTYTAVLQATNEDIHKEQLHLSITVNTIDKNAPVIEMVSYDKKEKMINIKAKDLQPDGSQGSGLAEKAYSYDGGKTWSEENQSRIEGVGTFHILVRDRCDNTAKKELFVEKEEVKEEVEDEVKEEVKEEEPREEESDEEEEEEVPDTDSEEDSSKKAGGGNGNKGNGEGGGNNRESDGENTEATPIIDEKKEEKELPILSVKKPAVKKKSGAKEVKGKSRKTPGMVLREEEQNYEVKRETKKQEPLSAPPEREEIPVQSIKRENGSANIMKAAAFTMGGVVGAAGILWLIYLLFGTVRIYHNDGEGKYHYAGSGIVKRKGGIFELNLPLMILEQSVTGQYCLKPGQLFVGRNKGKELVVTAGDRRLSVWIDEEIPLRL